MKLSFMKLLFALLVLNQMAVRAQDNTGLQTIRVDVDTTRRQKVTGFGTAALWTAMAPLRDPEPIKKLYGDDSPIGLNIMRIEICPNLNGAVGGTYSWRSYLPVVKEAKKRGALVFGTPWSPPASFKTNNSSSGGEGEANGNVWGTLKEGYEERFFNWLNTYLKFYYNQGAPIDVVSLQNEPDWWVGYTGCLYTPTQMHDLVAKGAHLLEKEKYGVRLMGCESLNFTPTYADSLLNDPETAQYIDIIGGHLYGNKPLDYMATTARIAQPMGKEVWMTEHTYDVGEGHFFPTWHEQLGFALEMNESMLAGANVYTQWWIMGRGGLCGDGEDVANYPENKWGEVLPRAYIMGHFAKHLKGATRLENSPHVPMNGSPFEFSSYLKGDSLILIAIDTLEMAYNVELHLPYKVVSGMRYISTEDNLYAQEEVVVAEGSNVQTLMMPCRSLSTYIFKVDTTQIVIDATEQRMELTTPFELVTHFFVPTYTLFNKKFSIYFHDSDNYMNVKYMLTDKLIEEGDKYSYLFRAEEVYVEGKKHYILYAYNTNYKTYETWIGNTLNLASGNVLFGGHSEAPNYGSDYLYGALWDIEYVEGKGFTFRSVATKDDRRYYMGRSSSPQSVAPVYWQCYDDALYINLATGIEDVQYSVPTAPSEIFDLGGRCINGQPTKGIYIKNGKKYIVK